MSSYLTYFEDVVSGKIVACKKIIKVSEIILSDRDNPERWHYDESEAKRYIDFIERFCRTPAGKLEPLILEPFQRAIIAVLFGFVDDDGNRRYRETFILIGRKNGKTTLAAAVCLALLVLDGEFAPEIYNVATSKDQSNKCYTAALHMIQKSPQLAEKARKRAYDIYCADNLGIIKSLSGNTNTLDGLDVAGAVIDEISAMKNRDLYDLVIQGTGSRSNPLVFEITTNGYVRDNIFDSQYDTSVKWLEGKSKDDRFIPFLYELDDRSEWEDESCWIKANPGLGTIKRLDYLQNMVAKAHDKPEFLSTVLTKDFNVKENQSVAWLSYNAIHNPERIDFKTAGFRYGIVGVDAADSIDLTAACVLCMRPNDDHIYSRVMGWIPQTVYESLTSNGNRQERDGVPYTLWVARDILRVWPGNIVDKRCVIEWCQELMDEEDLYFYACGYDPYHMTDQSVAMAYRDFFGEERFEVVRQGPQTLSQPMVEYKSDLEHHRIIDNSNPLLEWCRMNVQVVTDRNGNDMPDKKNHDRRNRIDAWAAELDAYITLKRYMEDYQNII